MPVIVKEIQKIQVATSFRRQVQVHKKNKIYYTGVHFSEDDELESVFSIEDEPTEETPFSLDVYEEYGDNYYQISDSKPQVKEEINSIMVIPQAEIKVYASKWDKPTHVTAFFDIGAALSLINPAVFPDEY
ncbi:uncharacterized protein LOC132060843 [Lycium ferocissimum]|uniref:uncharacterized protein LOC132060843 n=1 Tax=Lycium ferocissimum TaxID=112874 RepID=UPI00281523E2|nr:uncharacterized protein LOC132060843 [Lycium ferocissimum]